jgi:hypothetical protein
MYLAEEVSRGAILVEGASMADTLSAVIGAVAALSGVALTHSSEDAAWDEFRRAAALVDLIGTGRIRFEADKFLESKRVRPDHSIVVTKDAYDSLVQVIRGEVLGST